jgi:hypothetical protein
MFNKWIREELYLLSDIERMRKWNPG